MSKGRVGPPIKHFCTVIKHVFPSLLLLYWGFPSTGLRAVTGKTSGTSDDETESTVNQFGEPPFYSTGILQLTLARYLASPNGKVCDDHPNRHHILTTALLIKPHGASRCSRQGRRALSVQQRCCKIQRCCSIVCFFLWFCGAYVLNPQMCSHERKRNPAAVPTSWPGIFDASTVFV
jgi:hypothetical protein